eukprot:5144899-Pleurochrysis_carterae.AAC.3
MRAEDGREHSPLHPARVQLAIDGGVEAANVMRPEAKVDVRSGGGEARLKRQRRPRGGHVP